MFNCVICGIEIFVGNPKRFFCRDCYKQWESDIMAKTDWVKFCVNYEHQQRRQALKGQRWQTVLAHSAIQRGAQDERSRDRAKDG